MTCRQISLLTVMILNIASIKCFNLDLQELLHEGLSSITKQLKQHSLEDLEKTYEFYSYKHNISHSDIQKMMLLKEVISIKHEKISSFLFGLKTEDKWLITKFSNTHEIDLNFLLDVKTFQKKEISKAEKDLDEILQQERIVNRGKDVPLLSLIHYVRDAREKLDTETTLLNKIETLIEEKTKAPQKE